MEHCSSDYYDKISELSKLCKPVEAFEIDGVVFLGYWPEVVKAYAERNPSKKFFIWVCDNYERVKN